MQLFAIGQRLLLHSEHVATVVEYSRASDKYRVTVPGWVQSVRDGKNGQRPAQYWYDAHAFQYIPGEPKLAVVQDLNDKPAPAPQPKRERKPRPLSSAVPGLQFFFAYVEENADGKVLFREQYGPFETWEAACAEQRRIDPLMVARDDIPYAAFGGRSIVRVWGE